MALPDALGGVARQRIRGLIDALADGINDIVRRDETDRDTLAALRERARSSLDELGTARQAHRAYTHRQPAGSRFADRQG